MPFTFFYFFSGSHPSSPSSSTPLHTFIASMGVDTDLFQYGSRPHSPTLVSQLAKQNTADPTGPCHSPFTQSPSL